MMPFQMVLLVYPRMPSIYFLSLQLPLQDEVRYIQIKSNFMITYHPFRKQFEHVGR
jgi:hypothetical protein